MSEIVVKAAKTFRVALFFSFLILALAGVVMAREPAGCGGEIPDAAMSHHVAHASESQCFAIYAPAAGILMAEVNVPAWSPVEPRLELRGAVELTYLDRSPTSALVDVRAAGDYLVCVDAQQPELSLEDYEVAIGFAEAADAPAVKGGDPEEDEPDPDTNPLLSSPLDALMARRAVRALCRHSLADDHGDTLRCATPVRPGREVAAEIRNGLGDDDDVFVFTLDELRTVSIETAGDLDTFGGLYDHRGYRLKTADDGGEGGSFRIVKTLSPGRYFVRVGSRDGMEGPYRLSIAAPKP